MFSLTWSSECDQQVEPSLSQSIPSSVPHPSKDTSDRSSLLNPIEHSWLSILCDEKHEVSTVGIWRKQGPRLAKNHGGHEGSLGGKRRISTRAWANSRRSQGRARKTTSRRPSWPRAPLGSPYGRDWGLLNNYRGAFTSQRGTMEELAPTGLTSRSGTFPIFVIEG